VLKAYSRFARDLPPFLRSTFTHDETIEWVRARLAEREQALLTTVARCVFEYPQSPYLPLLKWAGCEFGDIEKLVT